MFLLDRFPRDVALEYGNQVRWQSVLRLQGQYCVRGCWCFIKRDESGSIELLKNRGARQDTAYETCSWKDAVNDVNLQVLRNILGFRSTLRGSDFHLSLGANP